MKNFGFKVVADIDDRSCAIEKEVDYEKSHNMFFPEHDSLTLDIEIRNKGEYVWGTIHTPCPMRITSLYGYNDDNRDDEWEANLIKRLLPVMTNSVATEWIDPSDFERSRIEEAIQDSKKRDEFITQVVRRNLIEYAENNLSHLVK